MKKYSMILFSVLVMFAIATSAQEQTKQKKAKGQSIENQVEKMATDLGLNDSEKVKVKTLLEKQQAERKKFNSENNKENADYNQKMKDFRKAQSAELKAVLGNEKFKKWQEMKAAANKAQKKPN